MRLSLRFIIPLMLALAAIAYSVVPLVDQLTLRWFVRDLDIRAELVANSLQEPLQEQLLVGKPAKIQAYLGRLIQDERLFGLGFCTQAGALIATRGFPAALRCDGLERFGNAEARLLQSDQGGMIYQPLVGLHQNVAELDLVVVVLGGCTICTPTRNGSCKPKTAVAICDLPALLLSLKPSCVCMRTAALGRLGCAYR